MARRAGRFPARRQGPRRATEWLASTDKSALQVLAAGAAIFDQFFNILEPATIVRTRGELWIASDQTSANEGPFGALGMAIVSDEAATVGITALPLPSTNSDSDLFFVHQFFQGYFATGQGKTWQRHTFDSKAMRKVDSSENIVVVLENSQATFGLDFIINFRVLLKLHS